MKIDGEKIALMMKKLLKQEIKKRKKRKIKLATILIGDSAEQLSFVKIKADVAKQLGIQFELVHLKSIPFFEELMHIVKDVSHDPTVTGVIIQQPLPAQLSTASIYNYIPPLKEIEGHQYKSPFSPPLGLAVLTVIKFAFGKVKINRNLLIDPKKDRLFFKKTLRNKKVVLAGRGITGGQPIGKTLSDFKINYISVNSKTPEPQIYYKEADVIITATGKKIIVPDFIKPGVVLINVGLRREGNKLKGDYEEKEIKDIASFYTPTPHGVGPIDVLYLYKNLIDAARLQKL